MEAENFQNFKAKTGVLYLADRAYGTPKGIASMLDAGGQVLCRVKATKYLPQTHPQKTVELEVERGRVIIAPVPPEKFAKVEKRMKRRANRSQGSIKNRALEANRYLCLFCSDESLSAEESIALYRWRWQIERACKIFCVNGFYISVDRRGAVQ